MKVSVFNRQRAFPVNLAWLRRLARLASVECLRVPARPGAPLQSLDAVEATVVSDRVIADVHARFFNDPAATDVITFDHGEILVSAGTAAANGARYKTGLNEELGLYIIHGMLHLNGHTDKKPDAARRMRRVQAGIYKKCTAALAMALCLLAPAFGAKDAPDVNAKAMLESLRAIKEQQQKTSKEQQSRALQQINAAAASPQSAMAFYEEAVKQTQFMGLNRENTQFRDWKKKQGDKLKEQNEREAVRLHLVYLGLAVQRGSGAKPADLVGPLMRYTSAINSLDANARNTPMLRDSLGGSIFVRWLAIEKQIASGEGDWEMVPNATDSIWEKTVLPVLRERKDQLAVDYWDDRIRRESTGAGEAERAFDAARFASIRKPGLLWNRAQEMLAIGQRNRAIGEMFGIIKSWPSHPSAGEWTASLEKLLQDQGETPAPGI